MEELLTELVVHGEPILKSHNGCTQHQETEKPKQHGQLVDLGCRLGVKAVAIASPAAAYTAAWRACAVYLQRRCNLVDVVVSLTVS